MTRKAINTILAIAVVMVVLPAYAQAADDYFVYANWNPGVGYTTGVNGYVDSNGDLGDPGEEYLFFTGGPSYGGVHTAYVYKVETAGDPDTHPDNPNNTGSIAPRTFTLVSSHAMGTYASGHDNAFYVDDTGIYYGSSDTAHSGVSGWGTVKGGGIFRWDFDWTNETCVVSTSAPAGTQTLARNPETGDWWVGTGDRALYRWDGSAWAYQFTHPSLAGSHHDGMEIIGDSLFISDMTSDKIIQYRLNVSGDVIDPGTPTNTFTYTAGSDVEGMGFGPNRHIWISGWSSYTIYELGGGKLQSEIEEPDTLCCPSVPVGPDTTVAVPTISPIGALILVGLLGIMAMGKIRRRFN